MQKYLNKLRSIILPQLPADYYASRKITLLGTISFAMFILAILTLINNLLFGITHESYRLYFVIVSILFSMFLLKKNKINFSIKVLLYCTLTFLLSVILSQNGVHDRALFAYPGLLVAAALLLEKRGFIVFSIITIISVPVLGFLEIKGILVNELSFSTTFVYIINTVLIFSITALFLRILVNTISENLNKLQLNEEELRNQKELIAQSENKFKSLFEGSMDPILLLDDKVKFVSCNDATIKILGANSKEEIIGKTPADLSPEFQPDGTTSLKMFELIIRNTINKGSELFEWELLRFDGSELFVEVSLSQIKIDKEDIILVHWRNITERKQAEVDLKQSQRRLNLAVEGAEIGLWDQDFKTNTVHRNEYWAKMLGYDPDEISSKRDFWLSIIHPDDFNFVMKDIDAIDKGLTDSSKTIQRLRCKDGSYKWILNWGKISERDENGNPLRATGVHIDIHDRVKAQELLKASEEKFRSIIQGLTDLIFIFDKKGKIIFQSPSVYKTLGYSEQDTIGRTPFEFIHPEDVKSAQIEMRKLFDSKFDGKPFLQRIRHKGGYYIYLESVGINMLSNKYVNGVVVFGRDVTERIVSDAALNESEKRFGELVINIQDPVLILSFEGKIIFANPACYKLVQIDESVELIGQSFSSFMSMQEAFRAFNDLKEVERNGGPVFVDYEIYTATGDIRWIETTGVKIVYEGRQVNLVTIKDITEKKLAQDILSNSEKRFKAVWENTLDGMRLTDQHGTIVLVNRAYCNLVEKERIELEGSNLSIVSHEEFKDIVSTKYIEQFENKSIKNNYECYLELWNNKTVFVEVAHTYISVFDHPELLLTVFHNISARKLAEDDLKVNEEKYRNLFDTMPNGYYRSTRDGYFVDANPAFIKMLGYDSLEELKKIYIPETIYVKPSERQDVLSNNPEFVEHLETYRLKTKDGRIIWIEDNARYITDENGNILFNEGICKDITDRKNAEEAMRESEIRFSIAFNSSPAPLVISEIGSGKIIDVNEQWIRMLGYSREENLNRSSKDLGIWDDPLIRDEAISEVKEKRYFKNIPVRFITKSGGFRDVYWSAEVISLKGNDVLLSMIYDYTEQKISEDRLKENEERFRITIEQTGQMVYDYDLKAEKIFRLGAIEMLTSYSREELQKTEEEDAWLSKIHPEDLKNVEEEFRAALKNVNVYTIEYRFRKKDNSYVYFEDNGVVIPDEYGKAIRVLGSIKDISERKLKFKEEIERSKRLEQQSSALVQISTHESLLKGDFQGALRFITEKISEIINTDRAGIWLYEMNDSALVCKDIFVASANNHSSGYVLEAKNYPKYFDSLHNKLAIDANDASTDIRTSEFLNSYLIPMGITSMLDVAIRESGRTIGVLCLEHTGEKRIWKEDEISFALHTAEQFSVVISNYKQKLVEEALEKSERKYRTLMESLNEAVMLVDNDDTVLFVNNKFTELMGYTSEEIIGKTGYEVLLDPADKDIMIKSNTERIAGKTNLYEVRQIKKNGESIDLLINGSPVYDDNGNVIGSIGAMTDITERKRAEKALQESETKYFTLFENASDAIFLMRSDVFIECNSRTLEIFGCQTRHQIVGHPPYEFSPPIQPSGENSRDLAIERISAALGGNPQSFEWVHSKLDGTLFYAEVSLNTIELGGQQLIQAIVRDITERKKNEEALAKSEEMYRTIITTVPDLIIRTDIDGNIIFINEKAFPTLPFLPLENFHGRNFLQFISLDDRARAMKNFDLMFKQSIGPQEYKLVFEDRTTIICEVNGDLIRNDQDVPIERVFVIRDITERKKSENIIKVKSENFKRIFELAPYGMVITKIGAPPEIIDVNQAYEEITELESEDLIGKQSTFFVQPSVAEEITNEFLNTGSVKDYELTFTSRKNNIKTLLLSSVRIDYDEVPSTLTIVKDITDQKKNEIELENYRHHLEELINERTGELETLNIKLQEEIVKQKEAEEKVKQALVKEKELGDLKTRFISIASHEFRTPLATMYSSTELLELFYKNDSSEKFLSQIDRIRNNIHHLTEIMDDVLVISRVDAGKVKYEPAIVKIETFMKEIVEDTGVLLSKNHKLNYKMSIMDEEIEIDEKLFKIVMMNLISNAIKYSPVGGTIGLEVARNKNKILFKISDQGIGIPAKDQKHLFEPFHRAENVGHIHGTGLGLAIVKKYVELHNGNIKIKTKIDEGTTFTITIPQAKDI